MPSSLIVPGFSGGVVLNASSDSQAVDELLEADGCDIGPRAQLVSAGQTSVYTNQVDINASVTLKPVFGMTSGQWLQATQVLFVAAGDLGLKYYVVIFDPSTEGAVISTATRFRLAGATVPPYGSLVTFASFPYADPTGVQVRPLLINMGSRGTDEPNASEGTRVMLLPLAISRLSNYDFLGTGVDGEFPGGTNSVQPHFRGIAAYNNHVFGWGWDNNVATTGDGPNRLMFSNVGNPLKWGNDNISPVGTDRAFADTDAINIGGAGESITGCLGSQGKLWIGTNRGLHYLQGYGRESFITDGTTGVAKSLDVVGPHALFEGPDGMLYGCSTRGLWVYDGKVEHIYRKLVNPNRKSPGFWDLIWYDASRDPGYPGKTNQDLVWMMSDPETQQIWTVIPFCNATTGYGPGLDTVIVKFHVESEGFTRQVILGLCLTHGVHVKRSGNNPDTTLAGDSHPSSTNAIYKYAARASENSSPTSSPMALTFGEYAPFGSDGIGICRVLYVTLSWENNGVLPITATLTPSVDQQSLTPVILKISATEPVAPADGTLWLSISNGDTNIGNATAGSMIPASNDHLLKCWIASWGKWKMVARADGSQGTRATIPIAITPTKGTRVKMRCQIAGGGRISIESLGLSPSTIRSAA